MGVKRFIINFYAFKIKFQTKKVLANINLYKIINF